MPFEPMGSMRNSRRNGQSLAAALRPAPVGAMPIGVLSGLRDDRARAWPDVAAMAQAVPSVVRGLLHWQPRHRRNAVYGPTRGALSRHRLRTMRGAERGFAEFRFRTAILEWR